MHLKSTISAQLIQSFKPITQLTSGQVYVPDLIRLVKERYSFVNAPPLDTTNVSTTPFTFAYGKFIRDSRTVVIDNLRIFPLADVTAVSATTRSSSEDTDALLSDLVQWTKEQFGFSIENSLPNVYLSQLEVILNISLSKLTVLNELCAALDARLQTYGLNIPAYRPSGVSLGLDLTTVSPPQTNQFIIERRANFPWSENIYFSQAPLKTDDHKAFLEEAERLLAV
jgi:hypothetical protein